MSTRREFLKALVGGTVAAWAGGLAPELGQRFFDGGFVPFAGPACIPFHCSRLRPDQMNLDGFDAAIEQLRRPSLLVPDHIALVRMKDKNGRQVFGFDVAWRAE